MTNQEEEDHYSFRIVDATPSTTRMPKRCGVIALALKQTSREATVLLYSPALVSHCKR
jgi:hypothetical protein